MTPTSPSTSDLANPDGNEEQHGYLGVANKPKRDQCQGWIRTGYGSAHIYECSITSYGTARYLCVGPHEQVKVVVTISALQQQSSKHDTHANLDWMVNEGPISERSAYSSRIHMVLIASNGIDIA
ncbi:hypothetical protein LA080_008795 [Diaporthe eres]|nr:hypothetical protein LA080_008795 [Diaporthe eres]